jgi:hypothetical protein
VIVEAEEEDVEHVAEAQEVAKHRKLTTQSVAGKTTFLISRTQNLDYQKIHTL